MSSTDIVAEHGPIGKADGVRIEIMVRCLYDQRECLVPYENYSADKWDGFIGARYHVIILIEGQKMSVATVDLRSIAVILKRAIQEKLGLPSTSDCDLTVDPEIVRDPPSTDPYCLKQ